MNPRNRPKEEEVSADAESDKLKDPKKGRGADPPALQVQAAGLRAPRGRAVDPKAPADQEGAERT